MNQKALDQFNEYLITIIGDGGCMSGKDIYEKIKLDFPDKLPSVVWSRLMWLVESKYLEIVYRDDDQVITEFKIRK